jgi:hypothetical protein
MKKTVLMYFKESAQHTPGGTEDSLKRVLLITIIVLSYDEIIIIIIIIQKTSE